ncbi:hypothetical protein M3182_05140 [Mesobacillus maritimus]|nr:hypothetical protein [Mesobacillus maritimus]MCM3585128.1 hypothetical protein [Mesobacillus maritimus]MCM3668019.1 hypothetical protein [Mesobacillus maritimus]
MKMCKSALAVRIPIIEEDPKKSKIICFKFIKTGYDGSVRTHVVAKDIVE